MGVGGVVPWPLQQTGRGCPMNHVSQSDSLFQEAGLGIQGRRARQAGQEGAGCGPLLSLTSLGRKGLKKQSSSLRRLMVRLLLVEVITSFTKDRTKARDSCRGWAPHSCGCWPQDPAAPTWAGTLWPPSPPGRR